MLESLTVNFEYPNYFNFCDYTKANIIDKYFNRYIMQEYQGKGERKIKKLDNKDFLYLLNKSFLSSDAIRFTLRNWEKDV